MSTVGIRELSHHTSRYLAQVKAGNAITITEHGRPIATISPADDGQPGGKPRPRIGGYRSGAPLDAEGIDAELAAGFGDIDRR